MKIGNVSQSLWNRFVLKQLHTERQETCFSPSVEETCSALNISQGKLAVCAHATATGKSGDVGVYAAARAFNDLTIRGAAPIGVSVQIILPLETAESMLKVLIRNIEKVCKTVNAQITAVRAEVNPAVTQMVVFVTAQGEAQEEHVRNAHGAVPGQDIVLCGYVGLEGMLRILNERIEELSHRFVPTFIQQMKDLSGNMLALEAIVAAREAGASAMHQIGSGGIFAGLWELTEASDIGMEIDLAKMTIRQETIELCEYYSLNPYQMTSAGSVLMTAEDGDELVKVLELAGARASKLGIATDQSARVIASGGEKRYLDRPAPDELMRWWKTNTNKTE